MAPAVRRTPRGPAQRSVGPLSTRRIQENALTDEVKRTILREYLTRYRNELMDDEERDVLWNRIVFLRRQLKLV